MEERSKRKRKKLTAKESLIKYYRNRETFLRWERETRKVKKQAGFCTNCKMGVPVVLGKRCCQKCLDYFREHQSKIRQHRALNGDCAYCGEPIDDQKYASCSRCRKKRLEAFYRRRKENGNSRSS